MDSIVRQIKQKRLIAIAADKSNRLIGLAVSEVLPFATLLKTGEAMGSLWREREKVVRRLSKIGAAAVK